MPDAKIVQFADDVTLITSDRDPERAVQKMNEALEQFERYAAGNWLAPEPTKTQVLYCTGVDKGKIKTKCEMAGQELEVTEAIKILGFHLDERLSGEEHCAKAAGKAAAATAAIKRATRYLRMEDKITLLEALAHPPRLLPKRAVQHDRGCRQPGPAGVQPNSEGSGRTRKDQTIIEESRMGKLGEAARSNQRSNGRKGCAG